MKEITKRVGSFRMGRNVDLRELLNLSGCVCYMCKDELIYLDEVDIDCDRTDYYPNCFKVNTVCVNCDTELEVKFNIKFEVDRK
jgi:hypothetical protein